MKWSDWQTAAGLWLLLSRAGPASCLLPPASWLRGCCHFTADTHTHRHRHRHRHTRACCWTSVCRYRTFFSPLSWVQKFTCEDECRGGAGLHPVRPAAQLLLAPLTWFPRTVRVRTRWPKRGGSRSRSGWDWPRRGPPPWPDWTTLWPDQQVSVTARFLSDPGACAWLSPNYRQVTDLLLCHCLSVKEPRTSLLTSVVICGYIYVSEHHSYKKAVKIIRKREKKIQIWQSIV